MYTSLDMNEQTRYVARVTKLMRYVVCLKWLMRESMSMDTDNVLYRKIIT